MKPCECHSWMSREMAEGEKGITGRERLNKKEDTPPMLRTWEKVQRSL